MWKPGLSHFEKEKHKSNFTCKSIVYIKQRNHIVAIHSKELWLAQGNHATVKLASSVDFHGIENLYIAKAELNCEIHKYCKIMQQNSSQFLSSDQPCELKNLDVAVIFAGVGNMPGKLAELEKLAVISVSTISTAVLNTWTLKKSELFTVNIGMLEAIWFEFWMKVALVTVAICVPYGRRFSTAFEN